MNLLKKDEKKLINHIINCDYEINFSNVICKWLVSLFIQNLSIEVKEDYNNEKLFYILYKISFYFEDE